MLQIQVVDPVELPLYLPTCEARLRDCLTDRNGDIEFEDLIDLLLSKQLVLILIHWNGSWIGEATLQQTIYPRKRYITTVTLSGKDFGDWMSEFLRVLLEFAKLKDFDGIQAVGRPGFMRKFPKHLNIKHSMWMRLDA